MSLTIDELNVSVRAYNSLSRAGLTTLAQIQALSNDEIRALKYMNLKLFAEIKGLTVTLQETKVAFTTTTQGIDAYLVVVGLPESQRPIVTEEVCPSCKARHVYKFINEAFKTKEVDDELIEFHYCKCASCSIPFVAEIEFCY